MSYSCFELEIDGGLAHVKFSRPKELNSMTREFWQELPRLMDVIERDTSCRAVVISSTGAHFTSGMDLGVFQTGDWLNNGTADERFRLRNIVLELQQIISRLEHSRLPILAAVQGGCIGGGLDLVAACDMRFCTSDAFFCIQEVNIGLMADLGSLQRLPKIIPDGVVREFAYTGDRMKADRAKDVGLVNAVYETHEEMVGAVLLLARRIAEKAPLVVSISKDSLNFARDHSVSESLARCADVQAAFLDRLAIGESMKAKAERRNPNFSNLELASFT